MVLSKINPANLLGKDGSSHVTTPNAITELINMRKRRIEIEDEEAAAEANAGNENDPNESATPRKVRRVNGKTSASGTPATPKGARGAKASASPSPATNGALVPVTPQGAGGDGNGLPPMALLIELDNAISKGKNAREPGTTVVAQIADTRQHFTSVCSRMSLLTVVKHNVSIGEISRRVFGPEEYSFSLLGGLLRRAKMPNSTNNLRDELQEAGVFLERGRRRSGSLSLFGSLVESEAIQLVNDFKRLIECHFPHVEIAQRVVESVSNVEERRIELGITKKIISEFINIINQDSSPVDLMYPPKVLPDAIQKPLEQFSMFTHGFGTPGIRTALEAFIAFVDAQAASL